MMVNNTKNHLTSLRNITAKILKIFVIQIRVKLPRFPPLLLSITYITNNHNDIIEVVPKNWTGC
jgi:hypothetical protein